MAPPSVCDSAVAPYLHGCPAFLQRHSPPRISLFPSLLAPQSTAALAPGLPSNPHSPAPSRCAFWWIPLPVRGMYGPGMDQLCGSRSTETFTHWLLYSLMASDASLLFQPNVLDSGIAPCFSSPTPGCRTVLLSLSHLPPSFLCPTEFFMDRYIPLGWSGTPASIHLLLGEKFCI